MKQLVFFASGSGSNFQSVIDAIEKGTIHARIAGLIASKAGIGAIERAQTHAIPVSVLHPSGFDNAEAYENALSETLAQWAPDLIVLAGYLLKIPRTIIDSYAGRIINIHPSLLPKFGGKGFYGLKVHKAVVDSGETQSGCSVHYVTPIYDDGPVIDQRTVPVHPDDSPQQLADRVLKEEHKLLPDVVQQLLTNSNS